MNLVLLSVIIFAIALLMTMTGRGGGNFYVLALVLSGVSMHESAASGQFILFVSSISATLVFGRGRHIEWKLVLFIGGLTALSAFFGGFYSQYFTGKTLKFIFSFFLLIAAILMMRTVKEKDPEPENNWGLWFLRSGEHEFIIDLKIAIPIVAATGFGAGMVGVSGGSFLVPLMVLACGVPMNLAVGTSTTMVAGTALMGFLGHMATGHFVPQTAIPLAGAAAIGGLLGGSFAIKTKPAFLKMLFAVTTLAASTVMVANAMMTH
ncbi:MAG: sulfite exporter TauE/SafE family protein [Spirochaetota bacterium]